MPFNWRNRRNKRKVWGFLCDNQIALFVKLQSRNLQVPIFCVAEHIIQLGGTAVSRALEDEQATQDLRSHLIEEHLLLPSLDPENEYDKAALAKANELELRRQEVESVALELIQLADKENINLKFLVALAKGMVQNLRERRRQINDIPRRR